MKYPQFIRIKEVGPRDGLQNEEVFVPTDDKVELIERLGDAGLREIEFSSFVHPKWIPALSDAREVGRRIKRREGVSYSALVPNEKGLEMALEVGIDNASVFMSASESHNRRNINKSIEKTFPVLKSVVEGAKAEGKHVTAYVSTAFDCPYDGRTPKEDVLFVCERLLDMGADEISIGDTIGSATPEEVERLLEVLLPRIPKESIIMHFHDTKKRALENIMVSMDMGITRFDSSIGGLGGCPYAPGASGNVSTNALVVALHALGIQTGIDQRKLNEAETFIRGKVKK